MIEYGEDEITRSLKSTNLESNNLDKFNIDDIMNKIENVLLGLKEEYPKSLTTRDNHIHDSKLFSCYLKEEPKLQEKEDIVDENIIANVVNTDNKPKTESNHQVNLKKIKHTRKLSFRDGYANDKRKTLSKSNFMHK